MCNPLHLLLCRPPASLYHLSKAFALNQLLYSNHKVKTFCWKSDRQPENERPMEFALANDKLHNCMGLESQMGSKKFARYCITCLKHCMLWHQITKDQQVCKTLQSLKAELESSKCETQFESGHTQKWMLFLLELRSMPGHHHCPLQSSLYMQECQNGSSCARHQPLSQTAQAASSPPWCAGTKP